MAESKYIERQVAVDALGKQPEVYSWEDELMREQWERDKAAIEAIPPADVRPVVLCKNCANTKRDSCDDAIYCKVWDRWEMPPDGYCYKGKMRKE